jgi:DNA-binding response OmpR family regulator
VGHSVELCHDGEQGLGLVQCRAYDLVVLDLMLPGRDGYDVCREIRKMTRVQPIVLMLTARAREDDLVLGYEVGADDYLKKPFSVRELVSRVTALLRLRGRAANGEPSPLLSVGAITVDREARRAGAGNSELRLTPMEFALLLFLIERPGEVVSRDQLLFEVWGYSHAGSLRTVDTHVTRLRKKIALAGCDPEILRTVHRVGYSLATRGSEP